MNRSLCAHSMSCRRLYQTLCTGWSWWGKLDSASSSSQALFICTRHAVEKMPTMRSLHAAVAEIYRKTGHPDWRMSKKRRSANFPNRIVVLLNIRVRVTRRRQYSGPCRSPAQRANTPESYYWRSRAYNELASPSLHSPLAGCRFPGNSNELKAHIYSGQKRYAEAADEWRAARKFSPGDPQIQKQLAISLKFSQDYGRALPLFQDLLSAAAGVRRVELSRGRHSARTCSGQKRQSPCSSAPWNATRNYWPRNKSPCSRQTWPLVRLPKQFSTS